MRYPGQNKDKVTREGRVAKHPRVCEWLINNLLF